MGGGSGWIRNGWYKNPEDKPGIHTEYHTGYPLSLLYTGWAYVRAIPSHSTRRKSSHAMTNTVWVAEGTTVVFYIENIITPSPL